MVLQDLFNEFKEKGYIECNSHGIEKYSRKLQTKKLAEVIDTIDIDSFKFSKSHQTNKPFFNKIY